MKGTTNMATDQPVKIPTRTEVLENLHQKYFEAICGIIVNELPKYDGDSPLLLDSEDFPAIDTPSDIRERTEEDVAKLFSEEGCWQVTFRHYDGRRIISIQ